jgi:hypothetical protein
MADYDNDDVVIPQVDEIAIYFNKKADVVIVQKDGMGHDDNVVVVPFSHLKAVIKKLQELAKNRPEPEQG